MGPAAPEKACTTCDLSKPLDQFYRQSRGLLGRCSTCKLCFRAYYKNRWVTHKHKQQGNLKAWKKNNPDKVWAQFLRQYELTPDTYSVMLSTQENLCAVCSRPFGIRAHDKINIDHDHDTGVVRGLVHGACNLMLGLVKEDPIVLQGAIEYLRKHGK